MMPLTMRLLTLEIEFPKLEMARVRLLAPNRVTGGRPRHHAQWDSGGGGVVGTGREESGSLAMLGDAGSSIRVCPLDNDLTAVNNRDDVDGLKCEIPSPLYYIETPLNIF